MPFESYLNVDEIESALSNAAATYPALCEVITLPNATYEGRTSHAVRMRSGTSSNRPGVLFLGNVHAREWTGGDILIALMENILAAYDASTGITFQGKSYSAAEIQRIMETIEIFLFPDVNPDGRAYTQAGTDWRKNRRPFVGGVGVDLNRNYDFLWDANSYFSPALNFSYLYSVSSETYHGPSPFSEAEPQNIKWLIDNYPQIGFFVDIHSYGQKLMYIWGDDENQVISHEQSFDNPAYDGQRGLSGDAYGEFIYDFDHERVIRTVNRMYDALFAVRGKSYSAGQIFHQVGVSAGTSASYMFGRHIASSSQRKIFAMGIEVGTTHHPAPEEMTFIIDDIGATLTELCLRASESDLYIRDNIGDVGVEPSTGGLSSSPDIIVRKSPVADPATEFGNAALDPGSDKVEIGNDNYVYVRVHNRGGVAADATVRLYSAPLTTSCSPTLWSFIDEVDVPGVPPNGLKVSDAVIWPNVPDPGTANHFCLVALCGNTSDPIPDTGIIDSTSDFITFMRSCNNIAYRNVSFENTVPDGWAFVPFVMKGFSGQRPRYQLVIDGKDLPEGSRVELRTSRKWFRSRYLKLDNLSKRRSGTAHRELILRLGHKNVGHVHNLQLPQKAVPAFQLAVRLDSDSKHGKAYPIRLIQLWEGEEVGRITLQIRCMHRSKSRFLVHRNDRLVHRADCARVRDASSRYLIPFPNRESAVRDGYKPAPDCHKSPLGRKQK